MEGKLIKKDDHYFLEVEPYTLNTLQRNALIANTFDKPKGDILQLSLTNCQAIERGYDLDNCVDYFEKGKLYIQQDGVIILAGENGNDGIVIQDPLKTRGVGHYSHEWNPKAFCECSQKALEILGDKKFTEENLDKAFELGKYVEREDCTENYLAYKESLQQTEWDVTFDPEEKDAEGCLILKRK